MDAGTAEEFFKRCIDREAVTLEERLVIMAELIAEGKAKLGEIDDETGNQIVNELDKNNGAIGLSASDGVIGFKSNNVQNSDGNLN